MKTDPAAPLRAKLAEVAARHAGTVKSSQAIRNAAADRIDDIDERLPLLRRRIGYSDHAFTLYRNAVEERARLVRLIAT